MPEALRTARPHVRPDSGINIKRAIPAAADHHPLDLACPFAQELNALWSVVGLPSLRCLRVQFVDFLAFVAEGLGVLTGRAAARAGTSASACAPKDMAYRQIHSRKVWILASFSTIRYGISPTP